MTVTKLRPTFTFTEDRVEALRAIAPEAFADGKINWEVLHEALGDYLEEERGEVEHFGLTWPGKREARRLAHLPSAGTLRPAPGEGVSEESTRNLFIEGDNLEVLKLLQKSYKGRVKLIYIDPPYNTGQDFIYKDRFQQPLEEYLQATGQADEAGRVLVSNTQAGGRYHSNWLNMMYPRLRLARTLLRDDGAIFVSIDDHEVHHLRSLMAEVFGEENFVATIIWQKVYSPKNSARHFSEDHDYIVVFARSAETWLPSLLPRTKGMDDRYSNPDNDPRGDWKPSGLDARNYYSKGLYAITCPSGRRIAGPPSGRYWSVSEEKFWQLDQDHRIWWGPDGNSVPSIKRFLSDVKQGKVPQTLWSYADVGHTQEAKQILLDFVHFGQTDNVLNTVKPPRLLERILQIATSPETDDIVLDFFAGSATTAHAVLEQNFNDGGNRRFIMVQFPEPLPVEEPGLAAITDIGKQRIRAVTTALCDEGSSKLTAFASDVENLGFQVFKVDRSHFRAWQDYVGQNVDELQAMFDQVQSPLVDGWRAEDVLVEIQLMEGFPLDSRVTYLPEQSRNRVALVESDMVAHRLFVCLDARVEDETIDTLAMGPDDILVVLDSALSDTSKVRLEDGRRVKVI